MALPARSTEEKERKALYIYMQRPIEIFVTYLFLRKVFGNEQSIITDIVVVVNIIVDSIGF
jgi:hypothetical protein